MEKEAEIIKELIKDAAELGQQSAAVKKSQLETRNSYRRCRHLKPDTGVSLKPPRTGY